MIVYLTNCAKKKCIPQTVLDEWISTVLSKMQNKATVLSQKFSFPKTQSILHDAGVEKIFFQDLHDCFVVTTANMGSNILNTDPSGETIPYNFLLHPLLSAEP